MYQGSRIWKPHSNGKWSDGEKLLGNAISFVASS